eukprot:CAMPEP_0185772004 /NCGR_PEP_ID=MMETSP1174-20130828/66413_1 /TAXON_ID=35687 /ORGANISM="Dictyocha speculum, Strain CCMP1381" /LENGTH=911 /DNA_ID=CAMNT_0028458057 /DNA_START=274 /DNA_END=3009 /DNA_ORIENTATION=+
MTSFASIATPELKASEGDDNFQLLTSPKGSKNPWEVHKFGGASLATAGLYQQVGDLLITEAAGRGEGGIPTMSIVSAMGGMTDLLIKVVESALVDLDQAKTDLDFAVERQLSTLRELAPVDIVAPIQARIEDDAKDIYSLVRSLRLINSVPAVTMEVVTGFGEIWSAQTLHAYLMTKNVPCDWIDARDVLLVKSEGGSTGLGEKGSAATGGVVPLWEESNDLMASWWNKEGKAQGFHALDYDLAQPIVVVTGFVAKTGDGVPTTLKRSGSDYSATIFAKLTGAGRVTMWKNTNGVYTADPRVVPDAFSIDSLNYDEAMELAYFGAQVLHPSAMLPCIDENIPVYVRNIFNPSFKGTVIQGRSATLKDSNENMNVKSWQPGRGEVPIKGLTSIDKAALVMIEGASLIGATGVAERFMAAMANSGINVLIITQASSESSICIAVAENQGDQALAALKSAFELELARSTVNSVSLLKGMAIVAIVGEGMAFTTGVSATFMSSLAQAGVNIHLIAQGSSERQVAVVVSQKQSARALRAAHTAFTLGHKVTSCYLLGASGGLGGKLLTQLESQVDHLLDDFDIELKVSSISSSKKMLIQQNAPLKFSDMQEQLQSDDGAAQDFDLDALTKAIESDINPFRVIIDCTKSDDVADYYSRWIDSGINIISPSCAAAAGPLGRYKEIHNLISARSGQWEYESSVGAGLPIVTTARDLLQTGDKVKKITGCLSGTMAYLLGTMSETVSFSEAMSQAVHKSICEVDIRDDLSGLESARKVVIMAREIGMDIDLKDLKVESLLSDEIAAKEYTGDQSEVTAAVLEDIKSMDAHMEKMRLDALAEDKVLRYKVVINKEEGTCSQSLVAVGRKDPLFRLKSDENLISFRTKRYSGSPLIVKGAAAGADLQAAGIFCDILRLARQS